MNDKAKIFFTPIIIVFIFCMGKVVVPEIRDNYKLYTALWKDRKSVKDKIIEISNTKRSNVHFLINDSTIITHGHVKEEIFFITEVSVRNYKTFGFKLRCLPLSKVPFFRFDSDGCTHRNYDESLPLSLQQITPPHFHYFNTNGVPIAYKTEQLIEEKSKKALEDINLCIAHFCWEANIRLNKDEFPSVSILSKTLQLPLLGDDPNAGVNFI